jgi:hypothetical protein
MSELTRSDMPIPVVISEDKCTRSGMPIPVAIVGGVYIAPPPDTGTYTLQSVDGVISWVEAG